MSTDIFSVYIPPNKQVKEAEIISKLFYDTSELSMSQHHMGLQRHKRKGMTLGKMINNNDLYIYKDKTPININPFTGSYKAVDISLCVPSVYVDFSCKVLEDTCGSDHVPIIVENSEDNDKYPHLSMHSKKIYTKIKTRQILAH